MGRDEEEDEDERKRGSGNKKGKGRSEKAPPPENSGFFPLLPLLLPAGGGGRATQKNPPLPSPHFFIACESHFSFPLPPPPSPRHFSSFLCREHRKKRAERVSFSLENKAHLFKMALRWSFVHSSTRRIQFRLPANLCGQRDYTTAQSVELFPRLDLMARPLPFAVSPCMKGGRVRGLFHHRVPPLRGSK